MMPDSIHQSNSRCAAQQAMPNVQLTFGWPALGALGRRALAVLLGVALLGAAAAVREFDLNILKRRIEGGGATIRVKRGETVLLRWRTDEAASLHVHGYDLRAKLSPLAPTSMRFEARVAGRFAITAHEFGAVADHESRQKEHRETTLLHLEVLPE